MLDAVVVLLSACSHFASAVNERELGRLGRAPFSRSFSLVNSALTASAVVMSADTNFMRLGS
ncbi:hypothetical protein D3C76_1618490 [compost metagenome]